MECPWRRKRRGKQPAAAGGRADLPPKWRFHGMFHGDMLWAIFHDTSWGSFMGNVPFMLLREKRTLKWNVPSQNQTRQLEMAKFHGY